MKKQFVLLFAILFMAIGAFAQSSSSKSITDLEKAANSGDLAAMCELAYNYYNLGEYKKAAKLYKKAGEKGVTAAKTIYGKLLLTGTGVNRNKGGALKWIKEAAMEGEPEAMMCMFEFYKDGLEGYEMFLGSESQTPSSYKVFVAKDAKVSAEWLNKALEAGSPRAIKQKLQYINSTEEKVPFWEKAAAAGDKESMEELLKYYRSNEHWNYEQAVQYASLLGDEKTLASLKEQKESIDKKEAEFNALVTKANDGDTKAMYTLAEKYWAVKNYVEAAKMYRKAAEAGNAEAMNGIGFCYYRGFGVPKNYESAVYWFQKAADAGEVNAMCWLGDCYYEGSGVAKNETTALKWYEKATQKGSKYTQAQNRIAMAQKAKAVPGTWTLKNGDRTVAVYTFKNDHTYTAKYTNYLHNASRCYWTFTETGKWELSKDLVYVTPQTFTKPVVKVSAMANWQQKKMPSVVSQMTPSEYSRFLKEDISSSDRHVFKLISDSKMAVKIEHLTSDYDNTWGYLTKNSGSSSTASGKKSAASRKKTGKR